MTHALPRTRQHVPAGPVIVGYANWDTCDDTVSAIAASGVNVIVWFSLDLIKHPDTGRPLVKRGPDPVCVGRIVRELEARRLPTTHLIAFGGWNAPHVDTTFSAQTWFEALQEWNSEQARLGNFGGYQGFDWDIEGHDDPHNSGNVFTAAELDVMGELSQLLKRAGYIVTMAPAQSYLDVADGGFSRYLNLSTPWMADFPYKGLNSYGVLLAKYGSTELPQLSESVTASSATSVPTFDLVFLQIYEGWSRANHEIVDLVRSPLEYIPDLARRMYAGWTINFASDPSVQLPSQQVAVPPERLVIGLGNGWAGPNRGDEFLLLWPDELDAAYTELKRTGEAFRGFGFWNIHDEGRLVEADDRNETLFLAAELNKFLATRP